MARFIVFISLIHIIVSCKTSMMPTTVSKNKPSSIELVLDSYRLFSNQPLQNIKCNSKIETRIEGNNMNLNAELYLEPNKLIWASIYFFGFNGGKALITPKEIQLFEKLNKTYIKEDISSINQKLNIKGLNLTFDDLQNIIMGRLFFEPTASNYSYQLNESNHELSKLQVVSENIKEKYVEKVILDFKFRPIEIILKDESQNRIQIKYEEWVNLNEFFYPKNILIQSLNDDKVLFSIQHKNAELIKWSPIFEIPQNYKKRNL